MLWFLTSTTLLLLLALGLALLARSGRRIIESSTLLITALPLLSLGLECAVPVQLSTNWSLTFPSDSLTSAGFSSALTAIWVAGIFVHLVILARRWAQVLALKAGSASLPLESVSVISTCLSQPEEIIRSHFKTSASIQTPMVIPGLHSLVLLPAAWDTWPVRLQAGALRHEWHHLRHRDALWNLWMSLFRAALWFHPLAWLSVQVWTDACEKDADQAAVTGSDPASYAQDLLGLATLQPYAITGITGFLGSSRLALQRRIRSLLSSPHHDQAHQPFLLKISGPLLILVLTLICAWTGIRHHTLRLEEATLRLSANAFPADP
ncbi:M56 family metallopeptidase [Prosthecobacter sp. SYSU 5D2]|uniref:M56 family metallopeptidase n=1 Tax=Prosthecobacter sp. SYSU 5D2 TaxID=3134134 RepID=UPI0031FF34BD